MRKVGVAENLLIAMIITFTDFHERTCLHSIRYFIYILTYIHTYAQRPTYVHTQMLTYVELPMNQIPEGFTLLSHEIGLNQYPNVEERFIRNPFTKIARD